MKDISYKGNKKIITDNFYLDEINKNYLISYFEIKNMKEISLSYHTKDIENSDTLQIITITNIDNKLFTLHINKGYYFYNLKTLNNVIYSIYKMLLTEMNKLDVLFFQNYLVNNLYF